MNVLPSIYRQPGNLYPENSIILTHSGTYPIEIEHYLGKAGADAVYVLKKEELKDYYGPFIRFHANSKEHYVDYTRPKTFALYATFIYPITLGKGVVKESRGSVHNNRHSLVPILSVIAGLFTFITSYLPTRDILTIRNSKEVLRHTQQIRSFIQVSKKSDYNISKSQVYRGIEKVLCLRDKIYKRNLVSAIVSLALTILITVAAIATLVGIAVSIKPLLIISVVVLGIAALAYAIKTITESNNRFDIQNLKSMLYHNELLRKTLPPYDERMRQKDVLEKKDREISKTLKEQRLQLLRSAEKRELERQELERQRRRDLEQQEIARQYEEIQLQEILKSV